MTRVVVGNQLPQPSKRLSDREREILGWTADGKTTPEIAQILALTERTINFHMSNILKKLDAPNKTAAVMRAALLGILY
jgi:LuxR family transcriptional regulator